MVRICFVCLGNICRSPTAEGVMRHLLKAEGLADRVHLDSAGTGDWHVGRPPDARARKAGAARGFAIEGEARLFRPADFGRFDLVVAMDASNRSNLLAMAPDEASRAKVRLFRSFDPEAPAEAAVPDPYYGGEEGFSEVLDICEAASRGLIAWLRREGHL